MRVRQLNAASRWMRPYTLCADGGFPIPSPVQGEGMQRDSFHFQFKTIRRCPALPCNSTVCGAAPSLALNWKWNH